MVSPPVNLRSAGIVVNSPRTRLSFSSTDYLCAAQSYAIHWYGMVWGGMDTNPIHWERFPIGIDTFWNG